MLSQTLFFENIIEKFLNNDYKDNEEEYEIIHDGTRDHIFKYENFIFKTNQLKEIENYEHLNNYNFIPKCHLHYKGFLVYDYIHGDFLIDKQHNEKLYDRLYGKVIEYIYDLGRDGIIAIDLHQENIVIDKFNNIFFIDTGYFEIFNPKHKNINKLIDKAILDFEFSHV